MKIAESSCKQHEALHHPVVQDLCDWVDAAPDHQLAFAEVGSHKQECRRYARQSLLV